MSTERADAGTGAALLRDTVVALSERAPAVVAAAAEQLRGIRLGLSFNDGTAASLTPRRGRLVVGAGRADAADVEVVFDDRAMNLLFDLQCRPVDQVLPGSLDVRGAPEQVLAVWRAFTLLSQRGSGLRFVQRLWEEYRRRSPGLWGAVPAGGGTADVPEATGWTALDYLNRRRPAPAAPGGAAPDWSPATAPRLLWDGRAAAPWWEELPLTDADLVETMRVCRDRVAGEMRRLIPDREPRRDLYDLMRAYPARQGKGLRPTLTVAACVAFGGRAQDAVRSAAALELFHNGFLVHDDIADESTHRRGLPTLQVAHGAGLAVNVGDGLNLLAVDALLSNLTTLGLARTLGLIRETLHMCRESVEGQAMELGWIRHGEVPADDTSYLTMSTKKTGWYTCISPCRIGAVCAGVTDPAVLDRFDEAFRLIGIAFQIQDDVLNLVGDEVLYGKEALGDLWEGKRTVMLIHLLRTVPDPEERALLRKIVLRPRHEQNDADVRVVLRSMHRHGCVDYAVALADDLAARGIAHFERDLDVVPENQGKAVLRQIAHYVTSRPL
ncbi:polyprenyl synthetase family protein [Streptomyces griseus]|uniref:polyprenyl synthetase family protein n=1 Tax=Streptomyces griseus TaxID=1911 RepID=UPI00056215D0|nr:polyprenyl synthetase family protein [Streptomyces griseus]